MIFDQKKARKVGVTARTAAAAAGIFVFSKINIQLHAKKT
jgi:hypothetical protein